MAAAFVRYWVEVHLEGAEKDKAKAVSDQILGVAEVT